MEQIELKCQIEEWKSKYEQLSVSANKQKEMNEKYKSYYQKKGPQYKLKRLYKSAYFLGYLNACKQKVQEVGGLRGENHIKKVLSIQEEKIMKRQEALIEKKRDWLPIMPENRFKLLWDVLLILSLVIYAIIFPFQEHFLSEAEKDRYFYEYEMFITVQFLFDIVINCVTAYPDQNKRVITNLNLIMRNYLSSWFLLDFLSAFPFYLLSSSSKTSYISYLKYIKLPRLFKLQKITKQRYRRPLTIITAYIYQFTFKLGINMGIFGLLQLMSIMMVVNHYVACLYFGVANRDDESWLSGQGLNYQRSIYDLYVASIEWSFQTWTTVGYGEFSPVCLEEQVVCIAWMIFGVGFFYPYVLQSFNAFFKQVFYYQYLISDIRDPINQSTKILKLRQGIKDQINSFIDQNEYMKTYSWLDQNNHAFSLPINLRKKLFKICYKNLIEKIPFLQKDINLSIIMISECFFHRYSKNEYIYRYNDIANEIYFIYHGNIKLCDKEGNNFIILNQGCYFGETEVITKNNQRRIYFAQAKGDCTILIYRKYKFLNLLQDFPIIKTEFLEFSLSLQKKYKYLQKIFRDFDQNKRLIEMFDTGYKNTYQSQPTEFQIYINDQRIEQSRKLEKSCLNLSLINLFHRQREFYPHFGLKSTQTQKKKKNFNIMNKIKDFVDEKDFSSVFQNNKKKTEESNVHQKLKSQINAQYDQLTKKKIKSHIDWYDEQSEKNYFYQKKYNEISRKIQPAEIIRVRKDFILHNKSLQEYKDFEQSINENQDRLNQTLLKLQKNQTKIDDIIFKQYL